MPIAFTCPHCGHQTNVSTEFAGMTGPCAKCGKQITVPLMPGMSEAEGLPSAPASSGRSAATWIILLVVGVTLVSCLLCMGLGVLLPGVQAAREAARRAQCQNNLRQIGIALQEYSVDHGTFPPAYVVDADGNRMHSWRALLLPYLDEELAEKYDFKEPWNSEKNLALLPQMPSQYACPSDPDHEGGYTSYLASTGPDRVFQGPRPVSPNEIKDGTSRTLAVIESAFSEVPWLEPRDGDDDYEQGSAKTSLYSNHPGGSNVLYADGSADFLSDDIDPTVLTELELINDGARGERELGPPDSTADAIGESFDMEESSDESGSKSTSPDDTTLPEDTAPTDETAPTEEPASADEPAAPAEETPPPGDEPATEPSESAPE